MNKKRGLALLFITTSVIVGVIAFWLTIRQGVFRNTTMVIIYLSAVLFGVVGTILLFTELLDDYVLPMIEEFVEDVVDDREDLKKGNITFVHVSGFLLIFVTFGFAYLTTIFSKFSSMWGSIPVLIPTLIVLGFATWFLTKSSWFNSKRGRTPPIIFAVLLIGMILAPILGITRTENINRAIETPVGEYNYDYRVEQAMYMATDTGMNTVDFSFGILSGCDDDACFWIVVIILVVVATAILVIGSAYITHFWFFSGSIFLCGMWIIFIRELRVRPDN
jgi:hypothetical protein